MSIIASESMSKDIGFAWVCDTSFLLVGVRDIFSCDNVNNFVDWQQ